MRVSDKLLYIAQLNKDTESEIKSDYFILRDLYIFLEEHKKSSQFYIWDKSARKFTYVKDLKKKVISEFANFTKCKDYNDFKLIQDKIKLINEIFDFDSKDIDQ